MTSSPSPGWYQDPADASRVRYWNGTAWTHQVAPKPTAAPTPALAAPQQTPLTSTSTAATPTPQPAQPTAFQAETSAATSNPALPSLQPIATPQPSVEPAAPEPVTPVTPTAYVTPPPSAANEQWGVAGTTELPEEPAAPAAAAPTAVPAGGLPNINPLDAAALAATDLSGRPIDPSELPATTAEQTATQVPSDPWAAASGGYVAPGYGQPAQPYPPAPPPGYPPAPPATYGAGYGTYGATAPAIYNPKSPYGTGAKFDERYVGFGQAIGLGFRKYFVFSGRSSRSEYWWFILFLAIVNLAIRPIFGTMATQALASCPNGRLRFCSSIPVGYTTAVILEVVLTVALTIPQLAVMCRRLHDGNHSGAWILAPIMFLSTYYLLPLAVLAGIQLAIAPLMLGILIAGLLGILVSIFLLIWLSREGTMGGNKFGDPPAEGRERVQRLSVPR